MNVGNDKYLSSLMDFFCFAHPFESNTHKIFTYKSPIVLLLCIEKQLDSKVPFRLSRSLNGKFPQIDTIPLTLESVYVSCEMVHHGSCAECLFTRSYHVA